MRMPVKYKTHLVTNGSSLLANKNVKSLSTPEIQDHFDDGPPGCHLTTLCTTPATSPLGNNPVWIQNSTLGLCAECTTSYWCRMWFLCITCSAGSPARSILESPYLSLWRHPFALSLSVPTLSHCKLESTAQDLGLIYPCCYMLWIHTLETLLHFTINSRVHEENENSPQANIKFSLLVTFFLFNIAVMFALSSAIITENYNRLINVMQQGYLIRNTHQPLTHHVTSKTNKWGWWFHNAKLTNKLLTNFKEIRGVF